VDTTRLPRGDSQRISLGRFGLNEFQLLIRALENGAKNAIMVSVACAAAGIIVGMVTLTGMGLKFSSLVLDLSYGIKVLAIILIGAASLVLGMGLPVTASYIVLATLAGPALMDMGVPIMVAHMIVFWYSQYDRILVFTGRKRYSSCESCEFCRCRSSRGKSNENCLHFLEACQGSLYHSYSNGLQASPGHG
jgi:hypothetical protein